MWLVFIVLPPPHLLNNDTIAYYVETALSGGIFCSALPIFFLISGYYFFSKLEGWDWKQYRIKCKKRIKSLLIPYVLWNIAVIFFVILEAAASGMLHHNTDSLSLLWEEFADRGWGRMLWDSNGLGANSPINLPLWFVRDLMVLVLFSPVIFVIAKNLKFVGVMILIAFYLLGIELPIAGFSTTGIAFFTVGCYMRINKLEIVDNFRRYETCSYIVSLAALALQIYNAGGVHEAFYRKLLTLPVVISMFCITSHLKSDRRYKLLSSLSESSFFIYAFHFNFVLYFTGKVSEVIVPSFVPHSELVVYGFHIALTVMVCIITYKLLNRLAPSVLSMLMGGRI